MIQNIAFVCKGNICRSILAESIFKHIFYQYGLETILFSSFGTSDWHVGDRADYRAEEILTSLGIPLSKNIASQFTKSMSTRFDLIYCMDIQILEQIRITTDESNVICKLLNGTEFQDPYYHEYKQFEFLAKELILISNEMANKGRCS